MSTQAILLELLLAGFFAVACIRARAHTAGSGVAKLRDFFCLTDRLNRLARTRWQWFSMVVVLLAVRRQIGVPLVVEITVLAQFMVFLSLPVCKTATLAGKSR